MRLLEVVVGLPPVGAGEAERGRDRVPLRHGLLGEAEDGSDMGGHLFFYFLRVAAVALLVLRALRGRARAGCAGGEGGLRECQASKASSDVCRSLAVRVQQR